MYKEDELVIGRDGTLYKIMRKIPNKSAYDVLRVSDNRFKTISRYDILESHDEPSRCPICNTVWTVTFSPVLNTQWFDCAKCGKTKEQIELEGRETPPPLEEIKGEQGSLFTRTIKKGTLRNGVTNQGHVTSQQYKK